MSEWENEYNEQEKLEVEEGLQTSNTVIEAPVSKKAKNKKGKGMWIAVTAAIGLASFGGGSLYTSYQWINNEQTVEESTAPQTGETTTSEAIPTKTTYAGSDVIGVNVSSVAQNAADSVVEISTEVMVTDQFFGQFITQGAGSGVILSEDGYIITNNHVIEGAKKITVRLTNGNEYQAELIGTDPQTDVAVLKIEAGEDKIKAAKLGDSSALNVGEVAVAIGNPLGELGGTVTDGIISALDREITIGGRTMTLMQTNAAINPGNSGGGLFNSKSELIGIVVAKSAGSDVEGLGFAIPINKVKEIAGSLAEKGYVAGRPALGIKAIVIDSWQTAMQYGLDQTGIYVAELTEGSNAEESGLKVGDFIVGIEDTQVNVMEDISSILSNYNVGDEVKLTVARNGKFANVQLKLSELKPQEETVNEEELQDEAQGENRKDIFGNDKIMP